MYIQFHFVSERQILSLNRPPLLPFCKMLLRWRCYFPQSLGVIVVCMFFAFVSWQSLCIDIYFGHLIFLMPCSHSVEQSGTFAWAKPGCYSCSRNISGTSTESSAALKSELFERWQEPTASQLPLDLSLTLSSSAYMPRSCLYSGDILSGQISSRSPF